MRMTFAQVPKIDLLDAKFTRRQKAIASVKAITRANGNAACGRALRARWILDGGKLRLAWYCEGESDAVPLRHRRLLTRDSSPFRHNIRLALARWASLTTGAK